MRFIVQLSVLGLALILDLLLGDPPSDFHPVAWMGRLIGWGERLAPDAGPGITFVYGAAWVLFGMIICTLPVVGLLAGARWVGEILYIPAAALLLKSTFTYSGLARAAESVAHALSAADLTEARRLVSWHLVSRDTSALSGELVAAAAVESVAENITDGVVAPLLFFLFAGVPGAWAYRFFNTCDSMLGYHDPQHEYLGKFAARLDDVLNWFPARLTGLPMVGAAWLAGEDAANAWRVMWGQHGRTSSPNAGWTMSAMAGALNVTLEKVGHYRLEGGVEPLSADTIWRATRVAGLTVALFGVILVICLILVGRHSTI
ncbi:MAG: cobalamin biosynthesis protein [Anaerolineae bacterium]|nr:cobalamin biosynthesis protein [Anaerolineae bacterium]